MNIIKLSLVICSAAFSAAATINTQDVNMPQNENELTNDNRLALLLDNEAGRDRKRRSVLNDEDPLQVDQAAARKAERVKALQDVLYNNQYVRRRHRVRDKRQVLLVKKRIGNEVEIVQHHIMKREVKEGPAKSGDKPSDGNKRGIKDHLSNIWYTIINCFKDWYKRLTQ